MTGAVRQSGNQPARALMQDYGGWSRGRNAGASTPCCASACPL